MNEKTAAPVDAIQFEDEMIDLVEVESIEFNDSKRC
jgi:hypothetical protein